MARKKTAEERKDPEFGKRLVDARKAKGLTQKDMASSFGITEQGWAYYEKGREMRSNMIVQVCAILECSPSWLLGMKEEGQQLPPESDLLKALKSEFERMNTKGQQKVLEYAKDISKNSEYLVEVKKEVRDIASEIQAMGA